MGCKVTNSKGVRCGRETSRFRPGEVCVAHQHRMNRWGTYAADKPIRDYTKRGLNRTGEIQEGTTPSQKFWNLVVEDDLHFGWKGTRDHNGLPTHWDGKVQKTAAQFMWTELNGPLPKGARVKKTCRVPECINPDHLYVVGIERKEAAAA